jgi:hypothetical protein
MPEQEVWYTISAEAWTAYGWLRRVLGDTVEGQSRSLDEIAAFAVSKRFTSVGKYEA